MRPPRWCEGLPRFATHEGPRLVPKQCQCHPVTIKIRFTIPSMKNDTINAAQRVVLSVIRSSRWRCWATPGASATIGRELKSMNIIPRACIQSLAANTGKGREEYLRYDHTHKRLGSSDARYFCKVRFVNSRARACKKKRKTPKQALRGPEAHQFQHLRPKPTNKADRLNGARVT